MHIAILDIGKTNKKCFVFDEGYRIVFETNTHLPETTDEDGDPCEDLALLKAWILETLHKVLNDPRFSIQALNFTAYGASFVLLDAAGSECAPLYNYLKPFPADLKTKFYGDYGGEDKMALETASPVLGNLNSGLQLYRLKHRQPGLFQKLHTALHLPQYPYFLATGNRVSDITSIGCHTQLWDFGKQGYHDWVKEEGVLEKLAPVAENLTTFENLSNFGASQRYIHTGTGLHDSSAALIPYLACFREPFVLISTGTWCISLNPFNDQPLTPSELEQDCLCYLSYRGQPVKAARLFAGYEHEQAVKRIAAQYGVSEDFFKNTGFDESVRAALQNGKPPANAEEAYHEFLSQIIEKQVVSTRLAIGDSPVRRIFVDGGFSNNRIYMTLLARAFPEMEVNAAEVPQATALGAAMAIHDTWNPQPLPRNLIALHTYRASE